MKKQTAVEWLAFKFSESSEDELSQNINIWFAKAIAMEKENIEQAYWDGYQNIPSMKPEQYYNEIFGS